MAQEPAEAPPSVEVIDEGFANALTEATRAYLRGRHDEAIGLLSSLRVRLQHGEFVDPALAAETLIWLGEVLYKTGRSDEARAVFRELLERTPEWPINEYQHPSDVVAVYYDVARQVRASIAVRPSEAPPPPTPRAPWWVALPFGVPQALQKRPVAATTFAVLGVGFTATSIASSLHLAEVNVSNDGHPNGWTADEVPTRVNTERYAVQWPATALAYLTWAAGSLEARASARKTPVGLGAWGDPHGAGVVVAGQWGAPAR